MSITLRLEFCEDGGPFTKVFEESDSKKKYRIKIDPSKLVFNSNHSVKQLTLTNISTDTKNIIGLTFLPLENQDGFFTEDVEGKSPPVSTKLGYQQKAVASITYNNDRNKIPKNTIVVDVDGAPVQFDIPVSVKANALTGFDFGCIGPNHKIEGEMKLVNLGSTSKEFKIKYKEGQLILIEPTTGAVQPHSEQLIKVELETKHLGNIKEKVDVTLGYETKSVHVLATLKEPRDIPAQDSEDIPSSSAMEIVDNEGIPKAMEDTDRLK